MRCALQQKPARSLRRVALQRQRLQGGAPAEETSRLPNIGTVARRAADLIESCEQRLHGIDLLFSFGLTCLTGGLIIL